MEKNYIVYCHINSINNKKYVGITKQKPEQRWRHGKGYKGQTKFWNAIQKYGWNNFEHIILFENLTCDEALKKETELILYFNSIENGYNVELSTSITNHDEATRIKLHNAMLGKKHTEETKKHIAEIKQEACGKKVMCIETKVIYPSIGEASKQTGVDKSSISRVCKGRQITAGNFHWKFLEEDSDFLNVNKKDKRKRKVKCITTGKVYKSVTDAAKDTGSDPSNISKVCNGKYKTTNKLRWVWYLENE